MKLKIKSMLYLTLSYIPWICYWYLSSQNIRFAPVLGLILGLFVLCYEYRNKNYSLMDVFSIFYWVFAIIVTYIFGNNLFIHGDGYMGYGALAVVALTSLLCSKPFMHYYSQKDFNSDVPSSVVSYSANVSTIIWLIVFSISTVIFICIDEPVLAVVSSNIFVGFAIILCIIINTRISK